VLTQHPNNNNNNNNNNNKNKKATIIAYYTKRLAPNTSTFLQTTLTADAQSTNIAVKSVAFLLRIWEVRVSRLGPETGYPD
jgi:hypothetical protein